MFISISYKKMIQLFELRKGSSARTDLCCVFLSREKSGSSQLTTGASIQSGDISVRKLVSSHLSHTYQF